MSKLVIKESLVKYDLRTPKYRMRVAKAAKGKKAPYNRQGAHLSTHDALSEMDDEMFEEVDEQLREIEEAREKFWQEWWDAYFSS